MSYKMIFFLYCALLSGLAGVLCFEYYQVRKHDKELELLKDEYANYVLALKKLISEYSMLKEQVQKNDVFGDTKKKIFSSDTRDENEFVSMNRDPAYLKKSAIAFARRFNLEESVGRLYDANGLLIPTRNQRRSRYRAKPKEKKASLEKQVKSMQKEPIFDWPLERSQFWLSSHYGPRKKPDGSWGYHTGIDMAAPRGTMIKPAGEGVVVQAGDARGYGNMVLISHGRKFKTRYAHLNKILVKVGQKVSTSDCIGLVGSTGNVRKGRKGDGTHLHFEVLVFNKHVNPFFFLK